MRINLEIDEQLMQQAMLARKRKTKRAVIEEGLRLLIQVHGQARTRLLRGKVHWQGDPQESR
jgi:Arc/MetJ family transcription regulator